MKFNNKYYYIKVNQESEVLNELQEEKFRLIMENPLLNKIFSNSDNNYYILEDDILLGFFSLVMDDDVIKITSLYICEEYRNNGLATEVVNDVIWSVKHNRALNIKYVIANSFVESALFFLKKGFDFCKIDKKLDFKKKNIILFYKKI